MYMLTILGSRRDGENTCQSETAEVIKVHSIIAVPSAFMLSLCSWTSVVVWSTGRYLDGKQGIDHWNKVSESC